MNRSILGRTGLEVSIAGLGCGGQSRLGQANGNSTSESIDLVRAALDMGVNFIDTAPVYGTEEIVGRAVNGLRHKAVISTKTPILVRPGTSGPPPLTGAQTLRALERSLAHLKTDYIDVYHVHAVAPHQLDFVNTEIVPALIKAQEHGKVRYLGITEAFGAGDSSHQMLRQAIASDVWDVMMIGFNMLNPSAATGVLPEVRCRNLGSIAMFAVPRNIARSRSLQITIGAGGEVDQNEAGKAASGDLPTSSRGKLADVAYRYCRHESAMDIILTGTGSIGHLRENVASINGEPLAPEALHRLKALTKESAQQPA